MSSAGLTYSSGPLCLPAPGAVKGLVEVLKVAQKEKVVRVDLMCLRNLLTDPEIGLASDMVEAGLPKVVATRGLQVRHPIPCQLSQQNLQWRLCTAAELAAAGCCAFFRTRTFLKLQCCWWP